MPNNFIKDVAKQKHHSKEKVEKEYKKVKEAGKKKGVNNPDAYAVAVVEKMNKYKPKKDKK